MGMPANRKLKPHMKSFVGRTFATRRNNLIFIYENQNGSGARQQKLREEVGEAVMILDETNIRVRITLASGGTGWMAKHYLGKEVKSKQFAGVDSLAGLVNKLTKLYSELEQSTSPSVKEDDILSKADIKTMIDICQDLADIEHGKILNYHKS